MIGRSESTMRTSLIAAAAVIAMLFVTGAAVKPSGNFESDPHFTNAVPWSEMPRDDHGPLRFAVIGDRTGVARPGVFAQAMKQIGWLEPDFIIAIGDLIEGYTDDPVE